MPFPLQSLPEALHPFVEQTAAAIGCPVDLVAAPILPVAATALGSSWRIQAHNGWQEPAIFYMGLIAPPASGKTPAVNAVLPALSSLQTRESRFLTTDATVEALAKILSRTPDGILLHHDELVGWVQSMNAYRGGRGADRQFFSSVFSGQQITVDRKREPPIIVERPSVNVVGGTQPEMLSALADRHGRDDGFIHRILFSYPAIQRHCPALGAGVSEEAQEAWASAIFSLVERRSQDGEHVLQMSQAVLRRWHRWCSELEATASDGNRLQAAFAKFWSHSLRLILVLQQLHVVCGEASGRTIGRECVERALLLADYFAQHTRRAHQLLHRTADETRAMKVLHWLVRRGGPCTPRDVQRANVAGIRTASDARKTLDMLVDLGRCERTNQRAGNHREVETFEVSCSTRR
ncbi:MAG: DUF3987 domain-containing protein [Planctomycetia bacterium]|nr:DUF3987 domain-containing protein [Planctomycetia bacterium]